MNSIVVDLSYIIRVFHIQMQDYRKVWQVNDVQVAQKLDIGIFWGGASEFHTKTTGLVFFIFCDFFNHARDSYF